MTVELDLSNYATKADLKNATGVDTSHFAKKADLANSKPHVDKLDIDQLKNVPSKLSNFKSKVDKLYIDKWVPVPVDLSKLSDLVKNDVVKRDVYNADIINIEDKIHEITNWATNTTLNSEINEIKNKIPSITKLATTTALTAAENKIPDHNNDITTPEFNKLTDDNFTARLKQANLTIKRDIADFGRQIPMITKNFQ